MKTISLTVPMDYNALTRASDMLHDLAIDLSKEQPGTTVAEHEHTVTKAVGDASITETTKSVVTEAPAPSPAPAATTEPAATEVFAAPNADTVASVTEQPAESVQPAAPAESATTAEPVPTAAAPAGVEVDSDGLPWDHRIHALGAGGAHNKLKKTQQWKKKRGVDAALVAEVEAELRAAMSAGPANPVATEPAPAGNAEPSPAPASPASPAAAPITAAAAVQPASPAPAPAPAGGTTTFPALMAAITANGIDQAAVTAAVNAQGLTALPLLAARPDLIPAVAAALGV